VAVTFIVTYVLYVRHVGFIRSVRDS
jgi:hypothetical protein